MLAAATGFPTGCSIFNTYDILVPPDNTNSNPYVEIGLPYYLFLALAVGSTARSHKPITVRARPASCPPFWKREH